MRVEARTALDRACERLLTMQSTEGWWKGELRTNVTMDAEDMLLREFLGIRDERGTSQSAAWIRSQQRPDGTWANFFGGPGDLSTTLEAYWALRLAGDRADASHMRDAAVFIRDEGGIAKARVFTHVWMALFGLWPWEKVPSLPPELVLLPASAPLSIYDFACWARQTIVALSIVLALKPRHQLSFTLDELLVTEPSCTRLHSSRPGTWVRRLDRLARAYERHPLGTLRKHALACAEKWILDRQEADGGWGGIQPPWVYSLIALHLRGYRLDHPIMRRALAGLETFIVEEGETRRLEACQSPVWDTALSIIALSDAGLAGTHPAIVSAAEWLLRKEVRIKGDWAVRRADLDPGGWPFEFENAQYPDVDDTSIVVLALLRAGLSDERAARGAAERAAAWVEGMQSGNGGWGAFDADNTCTLLRNLPFLDFGEVLDEPSSDVTAHAIEMLCALGHDDAPSVQRAVRWLLAQQEPDGSWYGRWGVNHIYGTAAALPALIAAGIPTSADCVRRAVGWLYEHQNTDGGWGEDPRSYDDPEWIGRGESTASQTAWALIGLHAAGEPARDPRHPAISRALDWLVATQAPDGSWPEPRYTGTGFPHDFYINYDLYRIIFPIMALGRCIDRAAP